MSIFCGWLLAACSGGFYAPATPTPVPPTATATATLTNTPPPTPTATPTIHWPSPDQFRLRTHPDGDLYVGDRVSLEIIAPTEAAFAEEYTIQVADAQGALIGEAAFAPFGIGGRQQVTLEWAWDTAGLEAGAHAINLTLLPDGPSWQETITLLPADEIPFQEQHAHWAYEESDCCLLYYLTHTAAQRDLEALLTSADRQAERASTRLEVEFEEPITITLMARVLGHGGFASDEVYLSYLDRNYAGSNFDIVLHHEMVHILDARLGGELRPSLFIEGLAVYLTGGHFKSEPLLPRAAALLELTHEDRGESWYIPLAALADDFYHAQHEIGYLQAGALVEYMVNTWGWEAFDSFYRQIQPGGDGQAAAIDQALQTHLGLQLHELEDQFIAALENQPLTPELRADVRLSVQYYDTVRRYQQLLDPSAYFLSAWLPNGPQMRQYGLTADLLRRPNRVENITLETLLVTADEQLQRGEYQEADESLQAVNAVLSALTRQVAQPFEVHPLANTYYRTAVWLTEREYQVARIYIAGDHIVAEVSALGGYQMKLELTWEGDRLELQQSQ